ncbi:Uncharacterised protein [Chlamydia trachomatis]|nr:Uncharacterised protein [Chlamydia trachomatis]CRH74297.1 Uncharacterised protein [Chlamydia trachomatis]CRH87308.1 Uncharacterised protein [Chlamydia trachomatis]CRI74332.1 Uncharacterised protein [Chlamydia trachomatis]
MVVTNTLAVLCLISAIVLPEIVPAAGVLPPAALLTPQSPPGNTLLEGLTTEPTPKYPASKATAKRLST